MALFVSPDELVIGIVHSLHHNSEKNRFTTRRDKLHAAFYSLKQQYPDIFISFHFRDKGLFFECEELDQALFILEASQLLHRHNEIPRYYQIEDELEESFNGVRQKLNDAGIDDKKLTNLAEKVSYLIA